MKYPVVTHTIFEAKEFDISGPVPPGDIIFIDGKSYVMNERDIIDDFDGGYEYISISDIMTRFPPPTLEDGTIRKIIYGLNILD